MWLKDRMTSDEVIIEWHKRSSHCAFVTSLHVQSLFYLGQSVPLYWEIDIKNVFEQTIIKIILE